MLANEVSVGVNVTLIVTKPRMDGLNEQLRVNEFPALTTRFLHPAITTLLALKVIFPATFPTAVIALL